MLDTTKRATDYEVLSPWADADPIPARGITPRLDTLEGKKIGIITNDQWQAYRMMPRLKEMLEQDFKHIEVLPVDAYPQGNLLIGTEETAKAVKKSGVDAVIIGNAS